VTAAGAAQIADPANQVGAWHNNAAFVGIDSQAPAVSPPGGLTGGGLDDRFDFQLVSSSVLSDPTGLAYIAGTYHTFGNNGTVALNGNINDASNTALAEFGTTTQQQILNYLTSVADHLPVVADFSVAIPEPGTGVLILITCTGVLFRRRRQLMH
jgi:hypothetical protein